MSVVVPKVIVVDSATVLNILVCKFFQFLYVYAGVPVYWLAPFLLFEGLSPNLLNK